MVNHRKPLIIFFIIGFLLIIISYLTRGTTASMKVFLSSAANSIGFILLTVVLVSWLWGVLGGEPITETLSYLRSSISLLNDSKRNGVQRVLAVSGEFGSHGDWMARLKSARSRLDLLGYTLHVWTRGDNFENELFHLVQSGVHVRVMVMDEDNPNLSALMNTEQISSLSIDVVKSEIKAVKNLFTSLSKRVSQAGLKGSLCFRPVLMGVVVCQICRTDAELTAIPYLYSVNTSQSPLLLTQGQQARLFQSYANEFEALWQLNA